VLGGLRGWKEVLGVLWLRWIYGDVCHIGQGPGTAGTDIKPTIKIDARRSLYGIAQSLITRIQLIIASYGDDAPDYSD
jgi:hypothetical protein